MKFANAIERAVWDDVVREALGMVGRLNMHHERAPEMAPVIAADAVRVADYVIEARRRRTRGGAEE